MRDEQQRTQVNPLLVAVRNLTLIDVQQVLDYWYGSPSEYIEGMGVDLAKMLPRAEFEKILINKCRESESSAKPNINALIVEYSEKAVGFHTINPVHEGDFGVFHAHLWAEDMRGRGIGIQTYPKACRVFFERFNLRRILFKTPVQNVGALRVKEKLGIPCVGEEVIDFGVYKAGTRSRVYELTRALAEQKNYD